MTAIEIEVQVSTAPTFEADVQVGDSPAFDAEVQIAAPTFSVISVLPTGPRGLQGMSAYDVAVLDGFVGTESEWLEFLQGDPGPQGDSGGFYEHPQPTPSAVWTVAHNLGYRPGGVAVFDSTGTEWEGEVDHIDSNNLTITFTAAFGGVAYLS